MGASGATSELVLAVDGIHLETLRKALRQMVCHDAVIELPCRALQVGCYDQHWWCQMLYCLAVVVQVSRQQRLAGELKHFDSRMGKVSWMVLYSMP